MASGDVTLEQLKKQLEKSEAGRTKLRESLGLLREKALNTGELLRQHRVLKDKYELTVEDLEKERSAREEAGAEVKLAKQSVTESAKGLKSVGDQLRGCKSQAAAAQKTANDANKAAAAAAKTLSATQGDVKALKREITLLHGKLKSLQPSENIADAATKSEVAQLGQCVVRLQHQLQDLRNERKSNQEEREARSNAATHIKQLEAEVAAQRLDQKRLVLEMERWRSMFGSLFSNFAAAMGGHGPDTSPPPLPGGALWSSPETMEVVGEGFVRQGSVMSAVPVLGSTTVGGGVCGTSSGRPRGPRQGEGLAAAQMPDYTPTQGRQIVGKSKCCKVDTRPLRHQQSAAGSATAVTPKRTAGSPVLPSPGAKRLRHARDSSESEASTDASLDFDGEGDDWEGDDGDTAADIVQMALGRLTCYRGCLPTMQTASEVAQVLVAALHSGRVPMSSVVAGFETAVLECAGHLGGGALPTAAAADDTAAVVSTDESAAIMSHLVAGGEDAVSVASLKLLPMWCGWRVGHPCGFALVLQCAAMVATRLQGSPAAEGASCRKAPSSAASPGGVGAATGFQERLRAHLHCATTQAGGSAGSGNPRYFPTEACAAAAAAMVLSRQLGNIQAGRVLLWDLLNCAKTTGVRILPAVASALDAWPACLPPLSSGITRQKGTCSQQPAQLPVSAVHDALQALCVQKDVLYEKEDATLSDDSLSMVPPAASLLCTLGRKFWGWPPQCETSHHKVCGEH